MNDGKIPKTPSVTTESTALLDDNTLLRWGVYAAIGVFAGVFVAAGADDSPADDFSRLQIGLGIGASCFVATALICEVLRFEILRIPVTLLFFGWLYAGFFPMPWAAVCFVAVLILAAAVSAGVHVYRKSSTAEFRLRFFRIALALFLCPVLWFCQNVDRCLDRGGAWNWANWYCARD